MFKPSDKVDVCVIGSGAGGGVFAKELAQRGFSVVVLEGGRRLDPLRDYMAARPDWEIAGEINDKVFGVPALDKITFGTNNRHVPGEARGVGGSTLRYLAYAVRMRPDDFKIKSLDGVGDDWPITYENLVPYYRRVELELGVSGDANDPWTPSIEPYPNPAFPSSYPNKIIKRGCDKLGIKTWPAPMARLSRPFDGRPSCVQCGQCRLGCMNGSKSSIDVTYIRKAESTGRAEIRPQCVATQIKVDKKGLAQGVVYFDKNGVEYEQKARLIVVSGGAIQSPRLLLNSVSNLFPNGLANSSGLVGRYFTQHFGVQCTGRFAERIDQFRGFTGGDICQDFCKTNPKQPFARGYRLDLTSGISGPVRASRLFSSWGQLGKKQMAETFGYLAGLETLGEQLPDIRNRVEADNEVQDQYGMPVARLTMEWYENERVMLEYMKKHVKEIMAAAGTIEIVQMDTSKIGKSAHNLGTCRMGNDPRSSVLNSFCQTHDVPNLFVADGSFYVSGGTANPSLTIHAVAVRASDFIAEEGKKGNLWSI